MATDYTQRDVEAENEMMRHDARHKKIIELAAVLGDEPLTLALGDYVTYKGYVKIEGEGFIFGDLVGQECVVTSISPYGDKYGIDGCRWIPRTALKFERKADVNSMVRFSISVDIEDEEDDEDEEWEE